ncbi:MAG: hypothetical protein P4L71_21560 [Acetobacteraceae bacterium]|nr:hypothetical protein [Acetobacteraceae bacterium]
MRIFPILLGAGLLAGAALLAACTRSVWPALMPGVMGVLVLAGTLFERVRYQRLQDAPPGSGWSDTGERFVDPDTKSQVAVFFNAASGERRYVKRRGPLA